MKRVKELIESKGHDVYTTAPNTSVFDALQVMADKDIGALLVLDDDRIVGIFSERDYARKVILQGKLSREIPVSEIMSRDVICALPSHSMEECMALMTAKRIRHLPVVEDDKLTGVVSIGDVVHAVISEQQWTIEMLNEYITGKR